MAASMIDTQHLEGRQAELLQLQREYRNMEVNRRAYSEESQAMIRKQQKTIEKLRSDNDTLRNDIATIMRGSNRPMTIAQHQDIHRLHDGRQKYMIMIEEEKNTFHMMEKQIDEIRQAALDQRKSMGGVNAVKENNMMIEKQIRILENRLDKALIRFNEAIAGNKTLRDRIDDLRRERGVFENIYRKMERELIEKKKAMAEIIETSNHAYETRDTYQMEIAAIEQANRKEQEEFEEQMLELGKLLDTDLALPLPIRKSVSSKTLRESQQLSNPNLHKSASLPGDNIIIENAALERVQNFEDAFQKIRQSTGITDVEELVRIFIKNEDHNFSLFNYVNEQNNEIEKCEEQIQLLREEENKLMQESGDDVHHHKQVLRDLEAKLQSTESMAEKYDMRCHDLQKSVESLKQGINSLFEKLNLTEENPIEGVITESNMVSYLGHVEDKANRLIEEYFEVKPYLQDSYQDLGEMSRSTVFPQARVQISQHDNIHINPPKVDDYNSDDEDDDVEDDTRPFTLEELKIRTMNKIQRKGQNAAKASKKRRSLQRAINGARALN